MTAKQDSGEIQVSLSPKEIRALQHETSGQSVLAHVELDEDRENFWAIISNKLLDALAKESL